MPKFAVYYVPEPEDEFYLLGSSLLGYDVRARQEVPLPSDLQAQFAQLQSAAEWTVHARPFGLHLTITDSLTCDWAALPKVERELEELLACFDPAHPFTLQRRRYSGSELGQAGEAEHGAPLRAERVFAHIAYATGGSHQLVRHGVGLSPELSCSSP